MMYRETVQTSPLGTGNKRCSKDQACKISQKHAVIPSDIPTIFSYDQTHAIPHWLWNQPSAPPVHPEGDVKGCLGNAVKVSEPQKVSSHHISNIMDHEPT